MKDYEKYGIPDDIFLDVSSISKYYEISLIYNVNNIESALDKGFADLTDSDRALWGTIGYWTELEASLLLAGLNPNHWNLYTIAEKTFLDRDNLPIITHYFWLNEFQFLLAKDYLFIFERSNLFPKAPPIEWVKYYKQKIYETPLRDEILDLYGKDWLDYFNNELNHINQPDNHSTPDPQQTTSRREQQIEIIQTVIAALNFDSLHIPDLGKARIKKACLTLPRLFTVASFEHAWKAGLKEGYFRLTRV